MTATALRTTSWQAAGAGNRAGRLPLALVVLKSADQ